MGARQHFLPAAFIGGFSTDGTGRGRERLLWVARRDGRIFREKAENLAYERHLYTLKAGIGQDPMVVDRHLSAAEPRLGAAIDALQQAGWLSAGHWQTLVSFITSLFVRGPEFSDRFESRWPLGMLEMLSADNTTMARVLEQQRLFAPVMYASWRALRSSTPIVTNDLGYLPTLDSSTGRVGYNVPLRKDLTVGVFAGPGNTMVWRNGTWAIDIPVRSMASDLTRDLNRHVACNALNEIYGATRDAVEHARAGFHDEEQPPHGCGPGLLVPSGKALRDHEWDYMTMLSATAKPPPDGIAGYRMKWPSGTSWQQHKQLLADMADAA